MRTKSWKFVPRGELKQGIALKTTVFTGQKDGLFVNSKQPQAC
jgi:hypothetical protein